MNAQLKFDCSALIQRGYVIFGVGETDDDARQEAEQWLDADSSRDEGDNNGDLAVVPCTRALMEAVQKFGGDLSWASPNGRDDDGICLPEEVREAELADEDE